MFCRVQEGRAVREAVLADPEVASEVPEAALVAVRIENLLRLRRDSDADIIAVDVSAAVWQ